MDKRSETGRKKKHMDSLGIRANFLQTTISVWHWLNLNFTVILPNVYWGGKNVPLLEQNHNLGQIYLNFSSDFGQIYIR